METNYLQELIFNGSAWGVSVQVCWPGWGGWGDLCRLRCQFFQGRWDGRENQTQNNPLPLSCCFLLPRNVLTLLLFIARAFISGGFQAAYVYTPEVGEVPESGVGVGRGEWKVVRGRWGLGHGVG